MNIVLIENSPSVNQAAQAAKETAMRAGARARARRAAFVDCPYTEGSQEFYAWREGYRSALYAEQAARGVL